MKFPCQCRATASPRLVLGQLSALVCTLLLGGCATYQDESQALQQAWLVGDDLKAAFEAQGKANDSPEGIDALLWRLEEGTAFRSAAYFNESNTALSQAEARVEYYDSQAKVRISEHVLATLNNLSSLPYEGTSYDRIMLNTYKALNYLSLGDYEAARVELNRALERQREAVAANADAITEAEENANNASTMARSGDSDGYDVSRAEGDATFQRQINNSYGYLSTYSAYADYVNPFTVFLEGLFFMSNAGSISDLERARKSFERVQNMLPGNDYLRQDLAMVNARLNGEQLPHLTYVIFETGMAPSRTEERIDIPLFIFTDRVPYVGAAFPQLQFNDFYVPSLTAAVDSETSYETAIVSDMDAVVAQSFQNELPVIITRTLISAGVKAGIQYGIYEATKGDSTINAFAMIAAGIYAASTNRADLRTWLTLPKEFAYCRFPTPRDRIVDLHLRGAQSLSVDLLDARINVIYIKSNSPAASLSVQQFVMQKSDYPAPDLGNLKL